MRNNVAITTAVVAAVIIGSAVAAYAVVAQGWTDPTTTGNVLPIDDNHSPIAPIITTTEDHRPSPERGDDRSIPTTAPAEITETSTDDHGRGPEPGDDRGDAVSTSPSGASGTAAPGDDRGRGRSDGSHDGQGHH